MKKLAVLMMCFFTIFTSKHIYANTNKNSESVSNSNDGDNVKTGDAITDADLGEDEPEPNDSEKDYVYDAKDIEMKKDELLKTLDAYKQIDNIIVTNSLLNSYEGWKGTRYLWGGTTHKGVDCSALTRAMYAEVFNKQLPRVSVDQIKRGVKVKKSELIPGDLVYFKTLNRYNHVGIYIGNSLFVNSSSSRGVIISSLDNNYWRKYFRFGVRIVDIHKR